MIYRRHLEMPQIQTEDGSGAREAAWKELARIPVQPDFGRIGRGATVSFGCERKSGVTLKLELRTVSSPVRLGRN